MLFLFKRHNLTFESFQSDHPQNDKGFGGVDRPWNSCISLSPVLALWLQLKVIKKNNWDDVNLLNQNPGTLPLHIEGAPDRLRRCSKCCYHGRQEEGAIGEVLQLSLLINLGPQYLANSEFMECSNVIYFKIHAGALTGKIMLIEPPKDINWNFPRLYFWKRGKWIRCGKHFPIIGGKLQSFLLLVGNFKAHSLLFYVFTVFRAGCIFQPK